MSVSYTHLDVYKRQPSIGAIRHCVDINGKAWSEECIDFKNNHSFEVRFKTEAKDFPFPASQMYGGWEVDGDEKSSIVKVWWEIKPKPQWMSIIIISILYSNADNDFPNIIPVSYTHLDVYKRQVLAAIARKKFSNCRQWILTY